MDAPHIYIFANILDGLPIGAQILHAGGLQYCIEQVEELAVLEHDALFSARLDGVYMMTPAGEERVGEAQLHLSDRIQQAGITDNWFSEGWAFGNGVTCHKTRAKFETKLVNHECGRTLEEIIRQQGFLDFSKLRLYEAHDRTEGWQAYERRWRSGTCPQFSHYVHLTWMVVKHELSGYGYSRIQALVEEKVAPKFPEAYVCSSEPGKYLSTIRTGGDTPKKSQLDFEKLFLRRN